MSDSKPNKSQYLESTEKGKFAVYVFFTQQELRELEYHCNSRRMSIPKWIVGLIKEELALCAEEAEEGQ